MRPILRRLLVLGAAAGAGIALRNYLLRSYLKETTGPKQGDMQIVLDNGTIVEPDPTEAREFADIARKVLQVAEQAG